MAKTHNGNQPALLIVDVQVGVMRGTWDADRVTANVAHAVDRARRSGVPVIWVQHNSGDLPHGSPDWQWADALIPADGEARIDKRFNSAFEETSLETTLADLNAGHIVLAGAATNWCIRATAYAALDRGYDLTLLSDAHTTEPIELSADESIDAADIVTELNTVMTWLSYPGRTNRAVAVADLDFARIADVS